MLSENGRKMADKRVFALCILFILFSGFGNSSAKVIPEDKKEIAIVEGFRSAKFGMTEAEIYNTIQKDFNFVQGSVEKIENSIEKTTSIAVTLDKLMEKGGRARVVYILGYRSKKLIQINVIWGNPVNENPNPKSIVDAANLLRAYFFRKGFKKDDLVMNSRLDTRSMLLFRGNDANGAMVILIMKTPPQHKGGEEIQGKEFSLRLSYIQNPKNPDIFKVKEGEF